MKEWICREMSTSTSGNENGVLMMETELIRCKDCKYWGANGYRYGCINATPIMMENDYCSNAERKEE